MREHMASSLDSIAGRGQDATADPAIAQTNVPWGPAASAYPHPDEWIADDAEAIDADNGAPSKPAPSWLRRAIPLLWAAALTVAALQHAGEAERRMALREPSSSELDMRDRSAQEIKAAWRSIGTVTMAAEVKPAERAVETAEPVITQPHLEPATARDTQSKPQETERPLVEPVTEAMRAAAHSATAEKSTMGTSEPQVRDIDAAAAERKVSEEPAKAETRQILSPATSTDEPTKPNRKGRVTTSHTSQPKVAQTEPARAPRPSASSKKYVPFDGYSPRYFTIEQPSRTAP